MGTGFTNCRFMYLNDENVGDSVCVFTQDGNLEVYGVTLMPNELVDEYMRKAKNWDILMNVIAYSSSAAMIILLAFALANWLTT